MAQAEGLTLPFEGEEALRVDLLECFPYEGKKQHIVYESNEFSAVCPFSGLPDYGHFKMTYIPNKHIVELKSLKYYLTSYRNVGIYQEHATNKLYTDLETLLEPEFLEITLVYNTRGGIDTTTSINSKSQTPVNA